MDLEQILADKTTFADDIPLTIGTQTLTLGQVRQFSVSKQQQLSEKISGAERREKEAQDTSLKASMLLAELEKARNLVEAEKAKLPTAGSGGDDWDAEFWSPVKKQLSERDKKLDQALAGIESLTKSVTQAATIWAEDRWQNQFEKASPRLKKVEAYKDWDYAKVRDYAATNKILDANGFPSIEKTIAELTKASDLETIRAEAYAEGLKKGQTKARMESMPRPSSATGGATRSKGKSAVEEFGLEGLGDDVMSDADLMEKMSNLNDVLGEVQ